MWKIKKIFKKYIYGIILISTGYLVITHMLKEPKEYTDSRYKMHVIEESIYSTDNDATCVIPTLSVHNPEILKFYKTPKPLGCDSTEEDWIRCEQSICSVKESILTKKGNVVCTYTDIIRKNDYKVYEGKATKTKDIYILKDSDFAKVNCKAQNGDKWFGIAIGIRDSLERTVLSNTENKLENKQFNVLMFGFDSLSRNAFIRSLPKTYDYLTNSLETIVLEGYNIVGDGTPQALIPILTGHNELELPETRKRIKGSGYVDLYPMIWNDYENDGYITSFNEDIPNYGTFTYRLNGFQKQPTDHYMRTFYLELENYLSYYKKYCIGDVPTHKVMLNYTKNFMLKYSNHPKFIFSFHGELSHDSINLIKLADDDVHKWIKDLKEKRILENTILIIMADHGNRFADIRNTLQGKQEERLPFFSITLPELFRSRFPKEVVILKENSHRLTTPYDIHATLKDVLYLQQSSNSKRYLSTQSKNKRAYSLFKKIPKTRSCADAYIEPHWCSCLRWEFVNNTDSYFVHQLGHHVLNAINDYTNPFRTICELLNISKINWVMQMAPKDEMLRFKTNKDFDGYLADLSSKMQISKTFYQIKLTVTPGNSVFEASVTNDLENNIFITEVAQISRINKYGNQASCIYNVNPELRKFCYCKDQG